MDKIRIIFILPSKYEDESECTELMLQAYEACTQNVKNVEWVKEEAFESIDLNKTDFVIFEDFVGKNFEILKETKCAILGPWCVAICLMEGRPIPNFPWPIYNVAMVDCVVSCSFLSKNEKLDIKNYIQLMGGCYTDTLVTTNTHLITNCVKTEKYDLAAQRGLKVMTPEWIKEVWKASKTANVHCNNEIFDKYKVPPFYKLTICSTGLTSVDDRNELSKVVSENGGKVTGKLVLSATDILVCKGIEGSMSAKYKAARKHDKTIYCVTLDWIYDSVKNGYAQPWQKYPVKKGQSTPTKNNESINPNFSTMSAISFSGQESRTTLEETCLAPQNLFEAGSSSAVKRKASYQDEFGNLIDNLDIKKAKLAGQYLDGCSVYVAGFNLEHREKLTKIINLSGATRYNDITDRVTHVIVGDRSSHEIKLVRSKNYPVAMVTVKWLVKSIELQFPADEEEFLVAGDTSGEARNNSMEAHSSPLSKKGLQLLKADKTITEMEKSLLMPPPTEIPDKHEDILKLYSTGQSVQEEDDTLAQMLKDNSNFPTGSVASRKITKSTTLTLNKEPETSEFKAPRPSEPRPSEPRPSVNISDGSSMGNETSQPCDVFESFKFVLCGFDEEESALLKETIHSVGGEVVGKHEGNVHYTVFSVFNSTETRDVAGEIVNDLWVAECIAEAELREIKYYHLPLKLRATNLLENCVITCSGVTSYERNFLKNLIEAMGGVNQDQFARVASAKKSILASTHLISLEASGKKYEAALKWGVPVVTKDWLMECAKIGVFVHEKAYLLGDSKAPDRPEPESIPDPIPEPPSSTIVTIGTDKNAKEASSEKVSETEVNADNSYMHNFNEPDISDFKMSRVETPVNNKSVQKLKENDVSHYDTPPSSSRQSRVMTPVAQNMNLSTGACSQVTPVHQIMQEARKKHLTLKTTDNQTDSDSDDIKTPNTPLERFMTPNTNKKLRKKLQKWLDKIPAWVPPKRRDSTPLSELKRKMMLKAIGNSKWSDDDDSDIGMEGMEIDEVEKVVDKVFEEMEVDKAREVDKVMKTPNEVPENKAINDKLQQLEDMLTASNSSSNKRLSSRPFQSVVPPEVANVQILDSQAFTVGWDYGKNDAVPEPAAKQKIFMVSGLGEDIRQIIISQLESLGATVSVLSNFDPKCTHLICPKPARNEKTLSCMAAGKWILHTSYVEKSVKAGKFLNEELFEFGNPKKVSVALDFEDEKEKENVIRMNSMHWWRQEITRRGYGAFHDMRAIVVANKKEPIVRVIEAGGGVVIDMKPPFDEACSVNATHCLLEPKSVKRWQDYGPLARQGIFCVSTLYLSEFLHRTAKDVKDCILAPLTQYYSKN